DRLRARRTTRLRFLSRAGAMTRRSATTEAPHPSKCSAALPRAFADESPDTPCPTLRLPESRTPSPAIAGAEKRRIRFQPARVRGWHGRSGSSLDPGRGTSIHHPRPSAQCGSESTRRWIENAQGSTARRRPIEKSNWTQLHFDRTSALSCVCSLRQTATFLNPLRGRYPFISIIRSHGCYYLFLRALSIHQTAQDRLEERLRRAAQTAPSERAAIRRATGTGPWPVSYSQHRMWLLQQLDPGSSFYNVSRILRLEGSLDVCALDRALSEIVRRHAVLRTTIECPEGTPVQAVQPFEHVGLESSEPVGDEQCRDWIRDFTSRPFRLDSDLPFRYRLFRSTAQLHHLALVFHHAAVDGWSVGIVLRELGELYSAFSSGGVPRLAEQALGYVDFTVWQREQVQSPKIDEQFSFWKDHWRGVPEVLTLPLDRTRPVRPSHVGAREQIRISTDAVSRFRALMRSRRTTIFAGLFATLEVLLSRYAA